MGGILASVGLLMLSFGFIYKRLARQTINRYRLKTPFGFTNSEAVRTAHRL